MYIEINDFCKTIKDVKILENISLKLVGGKVYGFQGKNGSGKTMLLRGICGLLKATSGYISIDDKILGKDISFPESIGVLIENPAFISKYTGEKNLRIIAGIQNIITRDDIRETLIKVGLNPDDKRVYRKYSLGMKQRLGIACAVMEKPKIILLDEPINALDESGIKLVRNIILEAKKNGCLIIVACHDKEELELLSDEIYGFYEGKIINHYIVKKGVTDEDKNK